MNLCYNAKLVFFHHLTHQVLQGLLSLCQTRPTTPRLLLEPFSFSSFSFLESWSARWWPQNWVITTLCNLHICHFSFDLCFYRDTRLRQPPSLPLSLFPPLLAFLHLPPRLPWWALDYCCLSGFGLAAETWTGRHPAMRSFKNHQKHTPKPSFSNSTWKHSRGKSIFIAAAVGYNETTLWQ